MTIGEIKAVLVEMIAASSGIAPTAIRDDRPITSFGLNSVALVRLSGQLEELIDRPLKASLLYEYPTISALAEYLTEPVVASPVPVAKAAQSKIKQGGDIAIVGLACRMPKAANAEAFWQLLTSGEDGVGAVPKNRPSPGKDCELGDQRQAGYLDAIDDFDADYFNLAASEAESMDPQQRLLLMTAAEALLDAGIDIEDRQRRMGGVFIGASQSDYGQQLSAGGKLKPHVVLGNALSILANRISFAFNLSGPSLTVDTACSSSLVAVKQAMDALRNGSCDIALAGGANLLLNDAISNALANGGMLSPDQRCKTFDSTANGYVRSEGVGVLVLKPLNQAVADRDHIYCVLKGGAIVQDGLSNGLTAPNPQAQLEVYRRACEDADIDPATLSYIEFHGTGTPLGDPIEADTIGAFYGKAHGRQEPLLIGSVKSNVGHLEAAAGMAGLIKMALASDRGVLPGNLHYSTINPGIDLEDLNLSIVDELSSWPDGEGLSRFAVSSFGFGGTNCHLLLEHADHRDPQDPVVAQQARLARHAVTLSSRSADLLAEDSLSWTQWLAKTSENAPSSSLADIAYTTRKRRPNYPFRKTFVGSDPQELSAKISAWHANGATVQRSEDGPPFVALIFPGQGNHWSGSHGLLSADEHPLIRSTIVRCDEIARAHGADFSILDELSSASSNAFVDPEKAQLCIVALSIGLFEDAFARGLRADFVTGHSVGEISAAYAAGLLTLEDAVRLALLRGRAMEAAAGSGGTLAVGVDLEEAKALVATWPDDLAIAAINGPMSITLSGKADALEQAESRVRDRGGLTHWISRDMPFHCNLLDDAAAELVRQIDFLQPRKARAQFLSTVTGHVEEETVSDGRYWGRNISQTVLFEQAIMALVKEHGSKVLVEITPKAALCGPVRKCIASGADRDGATHVMPLISAEASSSEDEATGLLAGYAELADIGVVIEPNGSFSRRSRVVSLPPPAWSMQKYWLKGAAAAASSTNEDLLLGNLLFAEPDNSVAIWENHLSTAVFPILLDHGVGGFKVLPGAAQIGLMADALLRCGVDSPLGLADIEFESPILLPEDESEAVILRTKCQQIGDGDFALSLIGRSAGAGSDSLGQYHAHARTFVRDPNEARTAIDVEAFRADGQSRAISGEQLYQAISQTSLNYGVQFRRVEMLWVNEDEALAALNTDLRQSCPVETIDFRLLDGAFHGLAGLLQSRLGGTADTLGSLVPQAIGKLTLHDVGLTPHFSHLRLTDLDADKVEVALTVLDEAGQPVLSIESFKFARQSARPNDVELAQPVHFYEDRWRAISYQQERQIDTAGSIIVVGGSTDLSERLADQIRASGRHCLLVRHASEYRESDQQAEINLRSVEQWQQLFSTFKQSKHRPIDAIVDLGSWEDEDNGDVRDMLERYRALLTSYSFAGVSNALILFATSGMLDESVANLSTTPAAAALSGLLRTVPFENATILARCVAIDPALSLEAVASEILDEIAFRDAETEVVRTQSGRLCRRLVETTAPPSVPPPIDSQSAYLITGGSGALGRSAVDWLVRSGAKRVVCLGRRPLDEELQTWIDSFDDPELDLRYAAVDLASPQRTAASIASVVDSDWVIKGMIHAAGALSDGPLLTEDWADIPIVFGAKCDGLKTLGSLPQLSDLSWTVLFSSAASILGSPGQAIYAAANAYLNGVARQVDDDRFGKVTSICWSPWGGGGMAAENDEALQANSGGIEMLQPSVACEIMGRCISAESKCALITPFELQNLAQYYPEGPGFSIFHDLIEDKDVILRSVGGHSQILDRSSLSQEFVAPRTEIEEIIAGIWRVALGIDQVGVNDNFFELGGDSVFGNQILVEISNKLDISPDPAKAFENFTIAGIAELVEAMLLENIENLTEEEAEALLSNA